MTRASRGFIAIGSLLACLVTGVAATAQDKPADNMDVLREKMPADKKLVVASVLELKESEAKVFWPVYNAYQSDMITHYDRLLKLVDTFGKNYETMSDEMSTKLLTDYLALERDYVALLNAYLPPLQEGAAAPEGRAPVPDREQGAGPRELRSRAWNSLCQVGAAGLAP